MRVDESLPLQRLPDLVYGEVIHVRWIRLVEGYTDKLYLNTFSNYFRRQGEDATFDYQTSLVDVDGSKTEYMVRFLDAEGYDYVVFLDGKYIGFKCQDVIYDTIYPTQNA